MAWERLCETDEIVPCEMRTFDVDGIVVLALRSDAGYMAIPPSCPHMSNPLVDGFFDGKVLTCNKHLWQWSAPGGRPQGVAEAPLLSYETKIEEGSLWVNLERELVYEHECEGCGDGD